MKQILFPFFFLACVTPLAIVQGQGPIDPESAPGESMKSLQEIWDRLGEIDTNIQTQAQQIQAQGQIIEAIAQGFDIELPWIIYDVPTFGGVLGNSAMTVSSKGEPLIAYVGFDGNTTLGYSRYRHGQWALNRVETKTGIFLQVGRGTAIAINAHQDINVHSPGFGRYQINNEDGIISKPAPRDQSALVSDDFLLRFSPEQILFSFARKAGDSRIPGLHPITLQQEQSDGNWLVEPLETAAAYVSDLSFLSDGQPLFLYGGTMGFNKTVPTQPREFFRLTELTGENWQQTDIPSVPGYLPVDHGATAAWVSLDIDSQGNPAIAYSTGLNHSLHFAYRRNDAWTFEVISNDSGRTLVSAYVSFKFTSKDEAIVAYQDPINSDVIVASRESGGWNHVIVDSSENAGFFCSLEILPNDQPIIHYQTRNESAEIKLATRGGL